MSCFECGLNLVDYVIAVGFNSVVAMLFFSYRLVWVLFG